MMRKGFFVVAALIVVAAFVVAAAPAASARTPVQSAVAAAGVLAPYTGTVSTPYLDVWKNSGHGDGAAEAWNHWPKGKIPVACAQCHVPAGFQEYIKTGKIVTDVAATLPHVLTCDGCHSPEAAALSQVKFPSGAVVKDLGPEARCMTCHQGRESTVSMNFWITNTLKVTDAAGLDTVITGLKDSKGVTVNVAFRNVHYFAAGATLYGNVAKGGYQYDGKEYDAKFDHVLGLDTCTACHNQHSLKLKVEVCAECHNEGKPMKVEDLKGIREPSMPMDYDGDGNKTEGIALEIQGLQAILYKSIQAYANDVAKTPIAYDGATYPYWFTAGADGKPSKDAKGAAVSYNNKWTVRLLQAAYNYQYVMKDPGSFAHNPKYTVELLYDSIVDISSKLAKPVVDLAKLHRNGPGHFDGSGMPFRDWDDTGTVPADCARCHSATGLPTFIKNAGTLAVDSRGSVLATGIVGMPASNGFQCTTCHDSANWPALYKVTGVTFPSGKSITFSTEKDDKGALKPVAANLCLECHQGRQSTNSLNSYLKNYKDADVVTSTIRFRNVHYFAAGATLFGTQAQVAYEYEGQAYNGYNEKHAAVKYGTCTDCHDQHGLEVKVAECAKCHAGIKSVADIRLSTTDWNGNKDAKEPIKKEIATFQERLYAAIQKYAADKSKTPIVYSGSAYPYFFVAGADGKPAKNDKGATIPYNAFSPRLLRAAYNYQFSQKDSGAYAHNPAYVMQFLYDSLKDIGGDVTGLTRPEAPKK